MTTIEKYRLIFDNTNPNWEPDPESNYEFIKAQVQHLQQKLTVNEALFVNEVLEAFKFERTPDGQVCGWIRRDGYILIEADRVEGTSDFIIKFAPQGVVINSI